MVSSPRLSLELIPNKYNVLSVRLDVIWNRISKCSLIIAEVNSNELGRPANALFETYVRTDLENLLVDYVPRPGFDNLNNFFESFFMSCNALVKYTMSLLGDYDCDTGKLECIPDILSLLPKTASGGHGNHAQGR